MDQITLLDAALRYAELGLSVIPLKTKDKKPYAKWEQYQKTPATREQILAWWTKWPNANIGIATGKTSGIFAIDFDAPEALATWEAKYEPMPSGLYYDTGKGRQYWFNFAGYDQGNKTAITKSVDLRGEGGYVMVPPSIHPNGKTYTWGNISALEHGLDELADCPGDMLDFCKKAHNTPAPETQKTQVPIPPITWNYDNKNKPVVSNAGEPVENWVENLMMNGAEKGARNASTAKIVGWMVRRYADKGMSKEDMLPLIIDAVKVWNTRNRPPLPEKEIITTCKSITEKHSFDTISKAIGSSIYQIEIVKRKFGGNRYNVCAGGDKILQCSISELLTLSLFRFKYCELTRNVIPVLKADTWYNMIRACLQDSTEREEGLDESPVSMLVAWMQSQAEKNKDEKSKLQHGPIVLDGIVHVTYEATVAFMQTTSYKNSTWEEIKGMLKAIGFVWDTKQSPIRINKKSQKTWRMPLESLTKLCNEETE